jgi:hypothetical protein
MAEERGVERVGIRLRAVDVDERLRRTRARVDVTRDLRRLEAVLREDEQRPGSRKIEGSPGPPHGRGLTRERQRDRRSQHGRP